MAETSSQKSIPTHASELFDLVRAYAKQETVEPLKGLARFVGFGIAGGLLVGTGLLLLAVGGLRALQTETGDTFDGNWSWVPYLIVLAVCAVAIVLVMSRVGKGRTK